MIAGFGMDDTDRKVDALGSSTVSSHAGDVLVVDDNRENLKLLSRILSASGYRVRLALNGSLALESVAERPPDLILLDVCMPDISGYEVCRRLQQDPSTRHIPVLFITAMGGIEDKVKGFEAGGRDYIIKPFYQEEVLARVKTHVALSRMHHELEALVRERTAELSETNERLLTEIESRRQAEAERKLLFEAIYQCHESIMITDTSGVIVFVNPAFERSTGFSRKEAIGRKPNILKSGRQSSEFYQKLWNTILGGKIWTGELVNKKKDGSLFTEKVSISPVFDSSGNIVNFIAVKYDITEQRLLEEQLRHAQKMETVGRLAGGVAHDYNNMLQVIMGSLQLITDRDGLDEKIVNQLVQIRKAAEHASEITRKLLAFSRKQASEPQVLDINRLLADEIVSMLERLLGEDVELCFIPGAKPSLIKIDPGQLNQIVTNLAINARDAMPDGGTLTIETSNFVFDEEFCKTHLGARPGRFVMLTVSDDGTGIDSDILPHIFEPFFTTKDEGKGTGLGLPSVYGIVKQSGGYIDVYSEPDRGTTFKLYFPLYEKASAHEDVSAPASSSDDEKMSPLRVLLVEDNVMVRDLAKDILESMGHHVIQTGMPEEAIEFCRNNRDGFDLLITDLVMPHMNGTELSYRVRKLCPNIRILYMSGYTANIIASHGVLDSNVNFIQKPFTIKALSEKIRETMERSP